MSFINPIELLGLQKLSFEKIGPLDIKNASLKLLSVLKSSPTNSLRFNDRLIITAKEVIEASDSLKSQREVIYWHFVANNPKLSNFLDSGRIDFFTQYEPHYFYYLNDFHEIIGNAFAQRLDNDALMLYHQNRWDELKTILSINPLINGNQVSTAYKSMFEICDDIEKKLKIKITEMQSLPPDAPIWEVR